MKRKFGYMLSPSLIFLICLFMLVCVGSVLYNFFRIIGLFNLVSSSLVWEISALVLPALFLTLLIFTLTARYTVADGLLRLRFGFWDVTGGKFKLEHIIKIVKAANSDKLYVNLYVNNEPRIVLINISPSVYKAFADSVRTANPKVLYEEADIN